MECIKFHKYIGGLLFNPLFSSIKFHLPQLNDDENKRIMITIPKMKKTTKNTSVVNENEIIKFTRNYRQFLFSPIPHLKYSFALWCCCYIHFGESVLLFFSLTSLFETKRNKMLRMQYDRKDGTFNGKTFMFEEQSVKRYNCHRNAK